MKALLLCAGFGKRLRPYTNKTSKCLLKLNGKPLLYYWINVLFSSGVDEILVNTHHYSEKIEKFIMGTKFSHKIKIVYEKTLLGTAGTIIRNRNFFNKSDFFVAHADNYCVCNLREFINAHYSRPNQTIMTMMTFNTDNPKKCGIVKLDQNKILKEFVEKPKNTSNSLANAAIYVMNKKICYYLLKIKNQKPDISHDLIPLLKNKIFTWHNNIYNRDIGDPISYMLAKKEVLGKLTLMKKFNWF